MNINKFFELAKLKGVQVSELNIYKNTSTSISLFRGEIDNNTISSNSLISARGIYNGKGGYASTEKNDATTPEYLVNSIVNGASLIEKDETPIIFEGSEKYHKKNVYSKALDEWKTEDIIKLLLSLESKLKKADKKVTEVQVQFEKCEGEKQIINSYGLKLKAKSNYFIIYASSIMKSGEEIKDDGKLVIGTDPSIIDVDAIVKEVTDKVNAKFNGKTIEAGSYKAVLNEESVSSLLHALINSCSSEETQKHSSLFEGKEGTKVLSSKLTVEEKPLVKDWTFSYFDDEGVATYNKKIINKGVLETLLYNLNTAKLANRETTGNGYKNGGKMGVGFENLFVKPGKLDEAELFNKIDNGVYITSIQGLHAGLNSTSGDFSLQAEGFRVENGKLSNPLTLITVSGNLFKLFNDIIAIGNNSKTLANAVTCPSIAFKLVKISAC